MSDAAELLAQLRDIHVPAATPEPALWPLFVTLALLLVVLFWLGSIFWRRQNDWAFELKSAISALQSQQPEAAIQGYAALLKRAVLTVEPESPLRTTHGESWLMHLDLFFKTDFFSKGDGRIFSEGIYRPVSLDQDSSRQLGKKLKQLVTRRSFRILSIRPGRRYFLLRRKQRS